ncbi:hypothetical protein HY971_02270 [Candidatus Kaiserbacteria bacterium]|nr:hypothetical protein [Candidatus Kaiserbacteria bacterium]
MMNEASNGVKREYGIYAGIAVLIAIGVIGTLGAKESASPSLPLPGTASTSSAETTATPSSSTSQTSPITKQKATPPVAFPSVFSLVPGDVVASWDFAGTHKDSGQLEASVRADITRLKGLINSGAHTNYELYVSIANQYELLGDGGKEFTYLNYALAIDSTKTGLAWHNMGKLLERLGAYKSARVAYDRMIAAQTTSQYIRARLEFLKAHMPEDTDAIQQAEADLAASVE